MGRGRGCFQPAPNKTSFDHNLCELQVRQLNNCPSERLVRSLAQQARERAETEGSWQDIDKSQADLRTQAMIRVALFEEGQLTSANLFAHARSSLGALSLA